MGPKTVSKSYPPQGKLEIFSKTTKKRSSWHLDADEKDPMAWVSLSGRFLRKSPIFIGENTKKRSKIKVQDAGAALSNYNFFNKFGLETQF